MPDNLHSSHFSKAHLTGALVFALLALLTALEFVLSWYATSSGLRPAATWPLLILIAMIKAGLVLYFYMHLPLLFSADTDGPGSYAYKLVTNRLGLWLFMVSDAFIFGGLYISRFNLLGLTRPELNQLLGLAVTSLLLASSFFANRAETSMALGNRREFLASAGITVILGVLFLVGVVGLEWQLAPFKAAENVIGAVFYVMTGFHAFHVLTGVIFLGIVLRNGLRGCYSTEKHWAVEAAAVYWHFVDVVWIFFYPALYLIGTAAT